MAVTPVTPRLAPYRNNHAPVPPQSAPPVVHGLNYVSSQTKNSMSVFLFPDVRTVHYVAKTYSFVSSGWAEPNVGSLGVFRIAITIIPR